ncbi:MAG TPA: hypothetical protein VJ718_02705, partial [Candidatus Binataceae bacterium]|nr:hypothetical protein [Candidatus Binataceae bacterium]
ADLGTKKAYSIDAYLEGVNLPNVADEEPASAMMWQLERQVLRFLDRRMAAAPPSITLKKALQASLWPSDRSVAFAQLELAAAPRVVSEPSLSR